MQANDLNHSVAEHNFVFRADDTSQWKEAKFKLKSVDDIKNVNDVRALVQINEYIKEYFLKSLQLVPAPVVLQKKHVPAKVTSWNATDEAQVETVIEMKDVEFSDFTITARSDVPDDYVKFSMRGKVVLGDIKNPRVIELVKGFTISHDE